MRSCELESEELLKKVVKQLTQIESRWVTVESGTKNRVLHDISQISTTQRGSPKQVRMHCNDAQRAK